MSTTVKLQSSANFNIFKYSHCLLVPERFLAKCLHGISQHPAHRCTPRALRDSKMYRNLYFILPYNTAYSKVILYIYIHVRACTVTIFELLSLKCSPTLTFSPSPSEVHPITSLHLPRPWLSPLLSAQHLGLCPADCRQPQCPEDLDPWDPYPWDLQKSKDLIFSPWIILDHFGLHVKSWGLPATQI